MVAHVTCDVGVVVVVVGQHKHSTIGGFLWLMESRLRPCSTRLNSHHDSDSITTKAVFYFNFQLFTFIPIHVSCSHVNNCPVFPLFSLFIFVCFFLFFCFFCFFLVSRRLPALFADWDTHTLISAWPSRETLWAFIPFYIYFLIIRFSYLY